VLSGDLIAIEFRDGGESHRVAITPGQVDWDVPSDFDQSRPQVIISVSDASGQTTFQTFDIHFPRIAKPQPVRHTPAPQRGGEKV